MYNAIKYILIAKKEDLNSERTFVHKDRVCYNLEEGRHGKGNEKLLFED